ncbi:MAG: tetratricopeptide repeat protein [Chloroflexota bacterium]
MKRVIITFLVFSIVLITLAINPSFTTEKLVAGASDTMAAANRQYETSQYLLASQAYQQLVDQGIVHPNLFYNLGNAYFKQGELGKAILNYRRAQLISPRDADISANLNLCRGQKVDRLENENNEGIITYLAGFTRQRLTLNELAILTLGLWFLVTILLMILITPLLKGNWKESIQYSCIILGLLLILCAVSLGSRLYVDHNSPDGVIQVKQVDVSSAPGGQSVKQFTLHDGAEVTIIEQRADWVRLALPGGKLQGWAPSNAVGIIQ